MSQPIILVLNCDGPDAEGLISALRHSIPVEASNAMVLGASPGECVTLQQYDDASKETAIYGDAIDRLVETADRGVIKRLLRQCYTALGLNAEAGEVADLVKKSIRDGGGFANAMDVRKEAGDTLWYLPALAREFDFTLVSMAGTNLQKLADRKARGKLSGSGDDR